MPFFLEHAIVVHKVDQMFDFWLLSQLMFRHCSTQLHVVLCRYSEFHPLLFHQHSKLDPAPVEFESFDKVNRTAVGNLNCFVMV